MIHMLRVFSLCFFAIPLSGQELELVKEAPEPTIEETKAFWSKKVQRIASSDGYGFQNPDGSTRVPPIYEELPKVPTSFMITKLHGQFGVIDDQNKILIPFGTYARITMNEGYTISRDEDTWVETIKHQEQIGLIVSKDKKYGLVNPFGKVMIPVQYDQLKGIGEQKYAAYEDGQWKVINNKNVQILPQKFDNIIPMFSDYSRIVMGLHEGLLKAPDTILLEPKYDVIYSGNWPYFDAQLDSLVYQFHIYEHTLTLSDKKPVSVYYESQLAGTPDCASFIRKSKSRGPSQGIYHKDLGWIILPVYDIVMSNIDCKCFIVNSYNNKRAIFDQSGKMILPFDYDLMYPSKRNANMLLAAIGKDYFFMNNNGEHVSNETYIKVEELRDGYYKVLSDRNLYALVNTEGIRITDYLYTGFMNSEKQGIAVRAIKGNITVCIDLEGKEIDCH